ncbi:MAG: hypothetical protein HZY79_15370 [Rhodoblastus sp.]|nr:MAG: hypothetical protein HZY79_15370 [Rhodoblastus sp.]
MKYPLIAAALLAASPSFASTRVIAVRRGVETNVGGYALYYRSSCQSAGVADVRVAHQPSHGVVRLARQLARAGRNAGCAGTR